VYDLLNTVDYPQNEFVDATGKPSSYYKIEEYDASDVLLNTSQCMLGDELLTKSSLRYELQHLCNVPIYDEEVIFYGGRTKGSLAFPYWNSIPKPDVRITGKSDEGDTDPMIQLSDTTPIYKTINAAYNPIMYSRDGIVDNYPNANNYPNGLKYKIDYKGGIYFIDADDNGELCRKFEVKAIPTFILIEDSKEIRRMNGAKTKEQIQEFING
jgi:hypothetical protein